MERAQHINRQRRWETLPSGAKASFLPGARARLKPRPSGSAVAEMASDSSQPRDGARPKAWLAWSSGKDSAWALHTVRQAGEFEVVALLTTVNRTHGRVAMHAVRESLLEMQAAAAGLRSVKVPIPSPCPNEVYESAMSEVMARARDEGVRHVIFGDLFLEDIRAYREKQLAGCGMTPVFPLWGKDTRRLAEEMIAGGLRAYLTCVDPRQLDRGFAGRRFDTELLAELPRQVDPCGENGEFHTFACAGPMFRTDVPVTVGEIVERDGFVFADLLPRGAAARTTITEKILAEADMATQNQELQQLLDKLRRLDQLKSDFFANVSDELRTPLTLILWPVEKLLATGHNLTEMQQRDLAVIQSNAARLLGYVNDLLDVPKISRASVLQGSPAAPYHLLGADLDLTEGKRAEEKLREYEKVVESSQEMIVVVDREYRYLIANRAFLSYRGLTRDQVVGHSVSEYMDRNTFELTRDKLEECFTGKNVQYELRFTYPRLGARDLVLSYFPIEGPSGVDRAACILRDVTESKQAEAALRMLSGRLLKLEDDERRRLARELHDSTAQRLAALAMNLSVVSESSDLVNPRARRAIGESLALADECLREIRTVAYLLHPQELDELGLQSALARYVDGFVQRSGVDVELEVSADLGRLPQEAETAIFRIVQECLANIHRHSGSRIASVHLLRRASEIVLEVADAGKGIDEGAVTGVGIASMRERVRQLDGSLQIAMHGSHSAVKTGTIIKVTIPLARDGA
jgi:uncharacterized protein (TIGR00290 family)/PAS domain S-box-containing protein